MYRSSIYRVLEVAESGVQQGLQTAELSEDRGVALQPTFESTEFDAALPDQVVESIRSSDLAIVDLTDNSPNVMYELGYLDAASIPAVLIRSSLSQTPIPVDVRGRYVVEYGDLGELESKLPVLLVKCIEESFRRARILPGDRDLAWFPSDVQELHLVGALSPDNLYSADPGFHNFVYLERFSDKDAVLDLMVLLSRMYEARVHKYTSEDFPKRQLLVADLVVVGGPGVQGVNDGNPICREMFSRVRSRVRYANDGESVEIDGDGADVSSRRLEPTYSREGLLLRDYGYFARFPNPFAPDATVVMINGLHTAGGLGAARAFSDLPQASENFRTVRAAIGGRGAAPAAFEALFEVETMAGNVLIPRISEDLVFAL